MDAAISLVLAFGFGLALTVNAAITGAVSRARGGREASLLTPISALPVIAILLAWIAYDEGGTKLPVPFEALAVFLVLVPAGWLLLWLFVRGLPLWCGSAGFLNGLGLVFVPRFVEDLGLALYFSVLTLGSCTGALVFDHFGLLGFVRRRVSLARAGGLALAGAGVVLVRTA